MTPTRRGDVCVSGHAGAGLRRGPLRSSALCVRAMRTPPNRATTQPSAGFRWLVLLACSVAMFGNYYVFDALYPVAPALQQQLGFSDQQIGLLDTAYNVAALLTLIAGGVLIDRLGTARSAVLFARRRRAGERVIAVLPAAVPGSPAIAMAAGRFVLGVGSELFIVAATTVVGRWFKGEGDLLRPRDPAPHRPARLVGGGQVAGPREGALHRLAAAAPARRRRSASSGSSSR